MFHSGTVKEKKHDRLLSGVFLRISYCSVQEDTGSYKFYTSSSYTYTINLSTALLHQNNCIVLEYLQTCFLLLCVPHMLPENSIITDSRDHK